jgi:hypothetical protein
MDHEHNPSHNIAPGVQSRPSVDWTIDELVATGAGFVAGLLVTAEAIDLCWQFVRFGP